MKPLLIITILLFAMKSSYSQTLSQIKKFRIKSISSYDHTYENGMVKYDTTIALMDTLGNTISIYQTYLLKDTNTFTYNFDAIGRPIERKQAVLHSSPGAGEDIYKYNPDGSYSELLNQGSVIEEKREYNNQGVLLSTYSNLDKAKNVFVLDSSGNYKQLVVSKPGKENRIINYKLSYDSEGRMIKRSEQNQTGMEIIVEYNKEGLPIGETIYFNKKDKTKKLVRTKVYTFY